MKYKYRIVKFKSGKFGIQAKAPSGVPIFWTILKEWYQTQEEAQKVLDNFVIVEVFETQESLGE